MTVAITGVGAAPTGRPRVVVSPLVELGCALHVLAGCPHPGLADWVAQTRAAMTPELAEATSAWSWATQAIRAVPFVTVDQPADFDEALAALSAAPAEHVAAGVLRPIVHAGGMGAARRWGHSRGGGVARMVDLLLDRPAAARDEFVAFLRQSRDGWFAGVWAESRQALSARAARLGAMIAAGEHGAAMESLDPSVTADPARSSVTIAKVQSRSHDVRRRGLVLAPSRFTSPHVYVADVPDQPLLLIAAADGASGTPRAVRPVELQARMRLLSSPAALEVVRAIATEPRTAGEVAVLWDIDVTQVTRQLRALERAGLAARTRHGRFVRYGLRHDAVQSLGPDVTAYLLR